MREGDSHYINEIAGTLLANGVKAPLTTQVVDEILARRMDRLEVWFSKAKSDAKVLDAIENEMLEIQAHNPA